MTAIGCNPSQRTLLFRHLLSYHLLKGFALPCYHSALECELHAEFRFHTLWHFKLESGPECVHSNGAMWLLSSARIRRRMLELKGLAYICLASDILSSPCEAASVQETTLKHELILRPGRELPKSANWRCFDLPANPSGLHPRRDSVFLAGM